jgi:hypothetical protein
MRHLGFVVYGAMVVALLGWANHSGWTWTSYNEVRAAPKSLRDNPGASRSTYQRFYHK